MSTHPHEQLLQTLSSMLIELQALQTLTDKQTAADTLRDGLGVLEHMTREALAQARASLEEWPLPELENVTLAEALSSLVEEAAERLGLSSRISFSGVDEQGHTGQQTLGPAAERLLFLVAREALYQVELHRGARRLRLILNYGQSDVQMSIEDDGVNESDVTSATEPPVTSTVPSATAESSERQSNSLPIINDLCQRLAQLGGTLEIGPVGTRGTRVHAQVPYAHTDAMPARVPQVVTHDRDEVATSAESAVDTIRLLIVDSHAVTRAGLHRLLETYAGLLVVGEAADGVQAVSETLELGPQVVLMDAQLPEGQTLEALRQIKQLNLDAKVLLLATQDREELLYETLRAGADGYVLKDIAPDELAQAVRAVARGEVLVQPQLAGRLLSRFGRSRNNERYDSLTARELDVLRLLALGLRNKEIAARLYVSERTVNFHLANIYQKLNVSGRTEALRKALDQGLIGA